jgi:hypothetical protein
MLKGVLLSRLHLVGPRSGEWNLLRQTEGERFMVFSKRMFLRENLKVENSKFD